MQLEILNGIIWSIFWGGWLVFIAACIAQALKKSRGQTKRPPQPPPAYQPSVRPRYLQTPSRGIAPEIKLAMCPECEATILAHVTVCPHCNTSRPICMICRYPFPLDAVALACPNCGGLAHRVHILEYLKGKGVCPNCQQTLDVQDLVEQRVGATSQHPPSTYLQFLCIVCHHNLQNTDQILECPHCEGKAHRIHFLEYLKVKGRCPSCLAELDPHQLISKIGLDSSDESVE
ncbi:MAG: hypothetical protein ACFE89_04765 [Candidatus Hodarchaeota archaeon]